MAEIVTRKGARVDLMHRACGVCDGCYLVGVEFLPPIQRCRDVHRYEDLTQKFAVITACGGEAACKREIVFPQREAAVGIKDTIRLCPAVHRIPRAADGVFKIHHRNSFNLDHRKLPFSYKLKIYIIYYSTRVPEKSMFGAYLFAFYGVFFGKEKM